jgi:hypothetical protein
MATFGKRLSAALVGLALLAGCGGRGNFLIERALVFQATSVLTLAQGQAAEGTVTVCPGIRATDDGIGAGTAAMYVGGGYALSLVGLPTGISVSWPDGDFNNIPPTVTMQRAQGLPDPSQSSDVRFCWDKRFRLIRAAGDTAAAGTLEVSVQLVVSADDVRTRALSLALVNAAGPITPPVAANCSAGRWVDMAAPPAASVSTGVFDATWLQDRVLLARAASNSVLIDEQSGSNWAQRTLISEGAVGSVRIRGLARTGGLQRFVAWRDTDFSRPPAEQTRIVLGSEDAGGGNWQQATVAANFEANVRSLDLAAWQGDAVLGWVSAGSAQLRQRDAAGAWGPLALPADLPATASANELRLATDPADDSLLLLLALRESDGVTRLRVWRTATPGATWLAWPALEAGPIDPNRSLVSLALSSRAGEVLLAWTYGELSFSANSRQTLQLRRSTVAATTWATVGDTASLVQAGTRYAQQALNLQVAQGCAGAAFLAWNEPGDYPQGAVHGAVADAAGLWNPFARADLAPLPTGGGAYASQVRLLVQADGRPVLAALLAPASGGPSPLVLRRYAAP